MRILCIDGPLSFLRSPHKNVGMSEMPVGLNVADLPNV